MEKLRKVLKAHDWAETPDEISDQMNKIPPPALQKPYPEDATLFDLIPASDLTVGKTPLIEVISRRKSHRSFTKDLLTIEELSFLLWATQGVRMVHEDSRHAKGFKSTKRTVPSGGSRHPFETYLLVNRVKELQPGVYRYLPLEHKLCFLSPAKAADLQEKIVDLCVGQKFSGNAAVVFIWTVIPYRSEWRYSIAAHKSIAIDVGHVCQNLYLASEAIGAGTCSIASYRQKELDELLGVDGKEEFTIIVNPVGKVRE